MSDVSTVEGFGVRAGAREVVPSRVALRDHGVLRLAVVRPLPAPAAPGTTPTETDHRLRVPKETVLLLTTIARIEIPLEIVGVTYDAVSVLLLLGVREGAEGSIVEVWRWCTVVECEWRRPHVAADVSEPASGQRAAAAAAACPAR